MGAQGHRRLGRGHPGSEQTIAQINRAPGGSLNSPWEPPHSPRYCRDSENADWEEASHSLLNTSPSAIAEPRLGPV